MRSHEVSSEIDSLLDWAFADVYRNEDSPLWNPYKLGEPLLTFWAIEKAQGTIDNGGFQYFFEKDWPDNPDYSLFINAYRRIGALDAANIMQYAVSLFPFENPHLDRPSRNSYLDSLRERQGRRRSVIDKLGYRVMDLGGETQILLAGYILSNIQEFPTAKSNLESVDRAFRARLDETLRKMAFGFMCNSLHRLFTQRFGLTDICFRGHFRGQ